MVIKQQWLIMKKERRKEYHYKAAIIDAIKFINEKRIEGHESIICIDINEHLIHNKGGITKSCKKYKLNDLLDHRHSGIRNNNTHQEGSAQIYFILCSFNLPTKLKRSGMTVFTEIASSDHRTLYIDLS